MGSSKDIFSFVGFLMNLHDHLNSLYPSVFSSSRINFLYRYLDLLKIMFLSSSMLIIKAFIILLLLCIGLFLPMA